MDKSIRGFTLVELVIVIGVIAILTAITVVSYSAIHNRASDSAVESGLNSIAKQLEVVRNSNNYPPDFSNIQYDKSTYATGIYNLIYVQGTDYSSGRSVYFLAAQSKSGNRFYITSQDPTIRPYSGPWYTSGDWTLFNYVTQLLTGSPYGLDNGALSTFIRP